MEQGLDMRLIETYIPAFLSIMKALFVLACFLFFEFSGAAMGSAYLLVGTGLFYDRVMFQHSGESMIDSNMSAGCLLLCFVVNNMRAAAVQPVWQEVMCNLLWCCFSVGVLLKDEIGAIKGAFEKLPDLLVCCVFFYLHSMVSTVPCNGLELCARCMSFQVISIAWFYTHHLRHGMSCDGFMLCMVRFLPVLFVGKVAACVFGGSSWVFILYRFYCYYHQYHLVPSPRPRRSPEKLSPRVAEEPSDDTMLLRELLKQQRLVEEA